VHRALRTAKRLAASTPRPHPHMSDRLGEIDKAVVTVVVSFPKPFF
jgi:hypothetical protein